jgi:pyrophosphatase PpaX
MAPHDELAKAYPGTRETLAELHRRGVPMGIVTSKGTEAATRGIQQFGLEGLMTVVVTADDTTRHKPDPYPLEFAAGLLGVDLRYSMYLGDSPHDMQAALSAHAIAVAALWGAFPREEVLVPGTQFALSTITDLPALLSGDAARFEVEEGAQ